MKTEFAFRETTDVTLSKVHLLKKQHSGDHIQSVQLDMEIDLENTFLDLVQPGLHEALYWNKDANDGQEDVPGLPATLPNLRFPKLNEGRFGLMRKKDRFAGYDVEIEYGIGDQRSNMAFDCCEVSNLRAEAKEGGSCTVKWRVQYAGDRLDTDSCGKLALMELDLIAVRLIPPAVVIEAEAEEELENPFPIQGKDPELTAGDIFAQGFDQDDDGPADSDNASETAQA